MQTPPYFPSLSLRTRRPVQQDPFRAQDPSFFDIHPVTEILRSVVLATIQWGLLTFAVYTVYSMVLGAH